MGLMVFDARRLLERLLHAPEPRVATRSVCGRRLRRTDRPDGGDR